MKQFFLANMEWLLELSHRSEVSVAFLYLAELEENPNNAVLLGTQIPTKATERIYLN
jgi:hypothetical protein